MNEPGGATDVIVSVRGEARTRVAPDFAVLHIKVAVRRGGKPGALRALAEAVALLTEGLAARGGQALTVTTERHPLTWSTRSVETYRQHRHRKPGEPVGPRRIAAIAWVDVGVRDLTQLDAVTGDLAGQPHAHLQSATWHVDEDNPAWARVRADAIRAALAKGADYATALGGSVVRVEQIADSGLLSDSGDRPDRSRHAYGISFSAQAASGEAGGSPTLDPVPQQLGAVIARVVAAVPPLAR